MSIVVERPSRMSSQLKAPLKGWARDPVGSVPTSPVPGEDDLLARNQGWVRKVLNTYGRQLIAMIGYEEALAVVQVGMLHAIRVWEPERGSLTNTGLLWMRAKISRELKYERYRSGAGRTCSLDQIHGAADSGYCMADLMHMDGEGQPTGQVSDGNMIVQWLQSRNQKGAQIALEYLGSSESLSKVGKRWGLTREMVRVYVVRWKGLAQDHFAVNGIRRAV